MNAASSLKIQNTLDPNGRPAGGFVKGLGLEIYWQNGPLGKAGTTERIPPNGAFVETVISAAKQRIEHYQTTEFKCPENEEAIEHLNKALDALDRRTQRRIAATTEGTHEGA